METEVTYEQFSKLFDLDVILSVTFKDVGDRLTVTRTDYTTRLRKVLGYRESRNYDELTMKRVFPSQERFYLTVD